MSGASALAATPRADASWTALASVGIGAFARDRDDARDLTAAMTTLTMVGVFLYRRIVGASGRIQGTMRTPPSARTSRRVPVDRMDEVDDSIVAFNGMLEKITIRLTTPSQVTRRRRRLPRRMADNRPGYR